MLKKYLFILLLAIYVFANSYDNGLDFYKKQKYQKAIDSFTIASNNDDHRAMYALGIIYTNGDSVKKDDKIALQWFIKSAKLGNIYAFNKLGNIYSVKKNYKEAVKWFTKAANKNDSNAAYNLGYFYTGGLGVKPNLKQSLYWYKESAKLGNINAQINLGFMYIAGHGTKVDYKQAAYWIQKAKNTGSSKANIMWKEFKLKNYIGTKK